MSIAPPSDIVLDVAQAADPTRLQAATARLAQLASGAGVGSADFGTALASARSTTAFAPATTAAPVVPNDHATHAARSTGSAYQKFEAMVLQSFVESMLPKDDDLFGDKASADPMRSMLAGQVADQLAKSGKLGIARILERSHGAFASRPQTFASALTLLPQTHPASVASR